MKPWTNWKGSSAYIENMKLAILLLCHKNPDQIVTLVHALEHSDIDVYIHIDKKSDIALSFAEESGGVFVLPSQLCVDVQWGSISQVDATLNLLEYAMHLGKYDYYWLCSGQDYPIKSMDQIIRFLQKSNQKNYINFFKSKNFEHIKENNYDKRNSIIYPDWMFSRNICKRILKRIYVKLTGGYEKTFCIFRRKNSTGMQFYFGSSWWCLNGATIAWIMDYIKTNSEYYHFFASCMNPDESFFHTLVKNSPYGSQCEDYLHYVDWSEGKSSPKTLRIEDFEYICASPKFMARKFDDQVDRRIIQKLKYYTDRDL